jgi:CRISPR/Cas system-associated exonuclease Cas4 (RecB family)
MKEWANDRGSRIHDDAEAFVNGKIELTPELTHFSSELFQAREMYANGKVETEQMWCFDEYWKEVPEDAYDKTKFRIKMDLTAELTPTHHLVADYKTGKRWGNEMKHEKQKVTYAIGLFQRKPEVTKVTTEVWYIDLPDEEVYPSVVTRNQGLVLLRGLDARNKRMLDATVFPPNANAFNCKWCPYNGKSGEVVCKHAVVTQPAKR